MANDFSSYIDYTALYQVGEDILEEYKKELKDVDAVASGRLKESADYQFDVDNKFIILKFILEDYWSIVEDGRTPNTHNKRPSFYPNIQRWCAVKGIDEKYAGAIWNNIRHYGDKAYREKKGRKPLEKSLKRVETNGMLEALCDVVADAFNGDIMVSLEDINTKGGKGRH